MKIYWVQDNDDGGTHYRTIKDARTGAQEAADYDGRPHDIMEFTVGRLTKQLFLDSLNDYGWAKSQRTVETIQPRKG